MSKDKSKRDITYVSGDDISEKLDELSGKIDETPSYQLYENILTTLHSIQRQLIVLNNRISNIEDRLRAKDMRENNRKIRMYNIDQSKPSSFMPDHTNNTNF